jgi:hypothetical protein
LTSAIHVHATCKQHESARPAQHPPVRSSRHGSHGVVLGAGVAVDKFVHTDDRGGAVLGAPGRAFWCAISAIDTIVRSVADVASAGVDDILRTTPGELLAVGGEGVWSAGPAWQAAAAPGACAPRGAHTLLAAGVPALQVGLARCQ